MVSQGEISRLKVVMYPAVGVKDENRYLDVLVNALRDAGVEVNGWRKHLSFQTGDVFHVHWPEIIPGIQSRRYHGLRGKWIAWQFFLTIQRVKKSGGRVVWTAHDLQPHWDDLRNDLFFKRFMAHFVGQVDIVLSLTEAGIDNIRRKIPALEKATFFVAHHPHYRSVLGSGSYDMAERARLGIKPEQKVFAFIGSLRANKRPELVASSFRDLPSRDNFLLVAGAASDDMAQTMHSLTAGLPNVRLDLRRIPEEEIIRLYGAADVLVFPGTDYFNSGTIYTALSLNLPVIAARSPTNEELQKLVGTEWIYLYDGDFSVQVLEEGARSLAKRGVGTVCNMSRFAPELCAKEHITAYRYGMKS